MSALGATSNRHLGRYELLFRVASGGMAEVHAGRVTGEAGFQKLVAIKCMLPSLADDEEFVQMFLDEARLAANISSPHVVQTFDLGRDQEGSLYIAMELIVGAALSRLIRTTRKGGEQVPVGVAIEAMAQAAQGLHDAHQATTPIGEPLCIVHRDISPQNILVGLDGRIRITDFGVARAVLRLTQTVAGKIKGKFAYSSPEQLGDGQVDQRSDIFSLGIVAWETLTGRRLFVGEHPLQTMERVKNMAIPSVSDLRPEVPADVSAVIATALQRDPEQRWSTSAAFSNALREAARTANVDMPTTEEFRTFVQEAGGEPLRRMRSNIKRALSNDCNFETIRESVEISLGGSSEGSGSGIVEKPEDESGLPISVEPPPRVAPGQYQATMRLDDSVSSVTEAAMIGNSRGTFLALLVLLAVGVGGGTWWLIKDPAVNEPPATAHEPRPAEVVVANPPALDEPEETAVDTTDDDSAATAVDETAVDEANAADENEVAETAEVDPEPEETDAERRRRERQQRRDARRADSDWNPARANPSAAIPSALLGPSRPNTPTPAPAPAMVEPAPAPRPTVTNERPVNSSGLASGWD